MVYFGQKFRLGYTVALNKSLLTPSTCVRYLGFMVDSSLQAFVIPADKKGKFAALREYILSQRYVTQKCLQRLQGKCISFSLAVPAAHLYINEMIRAVSLSSKNSRLIPVAGSLVAEIEHWRFVDDWEGFIPWRSERHWQVVLVTDASQFKWGASVITGIADIPRDFGDYFDTQDSRPIHLKEADALLSSLRSLKDRLRDCRVDVFVDNMAVVCAWEGKGSRDMYLVSLLKDIFIL